MVKLLKNGEALSVPEGTRVRELLTDGEQRLCTVCRVGGRTKSFDYRITAVNEGDVLSFPDLTDSESMKAYEATLRYICAMAVKQCFPHAHLRFSYHVSRSMLCEVLNRDFLMTKAFPVIEARVKEIIAADLPIERITVSKEEAEQVYLTAGYEDKTELLRYRPEATANLYRCGGYYNYLYSYMAPRTGCITDYRLIPYGNGMILQYPRAELGGTIPEFQDEGTYSRVLTEAYRWSAATDLQTVTAINHKVEKGELRDFVLLSEARHSRMLADLGDRVEKSREDVRLICIAGPSSSGKTTFCNRVRVELLSRGIRPVMISMDDYYLPTRIISERQGNPAEPDFEHINCLDTDRFNRDLFALISGEEVTLPRFNFLTGEREEGKTIRVDRNSPIMIEGIHALNHAVSASIPKQNKFRVFIAPQAQINLDNHSPLNTTDLRLIRRIVRDLRTRGTSVAGTIDMWRSVRNGEFRWIYPFQEGVDFVFNSFLPYELSVMGRYAMPALQEIPYDDPRFLVANRLMKHLKYFTPMEDESFIPCDSLLREFIGGSCF